MFYPLTLHAIQKIADSWPEYQLDGDGDGPEYHAHLAVWDAIKNAERAYLNSQDNEAGIWLRVANDWIDEFVRLAEKSLAQAP